MATFTALQMGVYVLASILYLGYLLGFRQRAPGTAVGTPPDRFAQAGRLALVIAVLLQFADIGTRCVHGQNPISSTPEAMAFVAFLIAAGFVLASFRYRLSAAGAFAVPAVLVLLLLARIVPEEPGAPVMGALGRTHVFLATVGVAVFTLAAVLAVLYLVEDRQLRRKRFDQLIGRKQASLETLDGLALRCVLLGFPIFTIALVTGALWVARLGLVSGAMALRPEYVLAVATWIAFGVLLVARVGAGWRGRKAAWLTVGGFGGAMLVLVAYFLRHAA